MGFLCESVFLYLCVSPASSWVLFLLFISSCSSFFLFILPYFTIVFQISFSNERERETETAVLPVPTKTQMRKNRKKLAFLLSPLFILIFMNVFIIQAHTYTLSTVHWLQACIHLTLLPFCLMHLIRPLFLNQESAEC